eukprot:215806_1
MASCLLYFYITYWMLHKLTFADQIYDEYFSDVGGVIANSGWECVGTCSPGNSGTRTSLSGGSYAIKTIDITHYYNLSLVWKMNQGYCKSRCEIYYKYNNHGSIWTLIGYIAAYSDGKTKELIPTTVGQTTSISLKISAPNSCSFTRIGLNGTRITSNPTKSPTIDPTTTPTNNPTIDPTASPTTKPTPQPTAIPTAYPTTEPTKEPTHHPTTSPTMEPVHMVNFFMDGKLCDNLHENTKILYEVTLNKCIDYCDEIDDECRMINYFHYFKSNNDSRCYIFSELCDIKDDIRYNNKSIIGYQSYIKECINYPYDWTDKIGDSCFYYETYNWCNNGNILKDENEYNNLIDLKYDLSAIESCCECGGGVFIVDNVQLSYDSSWIDEKNDILCNWIESDFTLQMNSQTTLRNWDNLILYDLCSNLDDIDCEFLINTQFESNYSYS